LQGNPSAQELEAGTAGGVLELRRVGSRAAGKNWKQQDLAQLLLPFHSSPALIATITCKTKQNATTSRFYFVLFLDLFPPVSSLQLWICNWLPPGGCSFCQWQIWWWS